MPQGVHENAINHFWDQNDIIEPHSDVTPPPIDMPLSPDIRIEHTHYFENHQARVTMASKILSE